VIKPIDPSVGPLLYPLLFPDGDIDTAYSIEMKKLNGKRLTMREYASSQLQFRDKPKFNPLTYGGMLTQQYIIDMCTRIEGERMDYLRKNQASLKVASYKGTVRAECNVSWSPLHNGAFSTNGLARSTGGTNGCIDSG